MRLPIAGLTFSTDATAVWTATDTGLTGLAGARTDLFVDPATGESFLNGPRLLTTPPTGDWQFSAHVRVDFGATYDAGVLLLWAGEDTWAKLCFEYSPQGQPMIVSVVTRGRSDDANGYTVDGNEVRLRISRVNGAYAFHACTDGRRWDLVRHFALADASVGFEVQSPMGQGCRVEFTDIAFARTTLTDLRDGS